MYLPHVVLHVYDSHVYVWQVTCGEAVELLEEKQIDQVPIVTDAGYTYVHDMLVPTDALS